MKYPFKETPILYGKDALRFDEEMRRVDAMSEEERQANWDALCKRVDAACKRWNIKIEI